MLVASNLAAAGYTPVSDSDRQRQLDRLECIYGPGFSTAGETDFYNEQLGIRIVRVQDFAGANPEDPGQPLDVAHPAAAATDQIWRGDVPSVTTRVWYSQAPSARYGITSRDFGYAGATGSVSGIRLSHAAADGCLPALGAEVSFEPDGDWRWTASEDSADSATVGWSSRSRDNDPDGDGIGEDRLLTYRVLSSGEESVTYLLFWDTDTSSDYADLVIEVVPAAPCLELLLAGGPDVDGNGRWDLVLDAASKVGAEYVFKLVYRNECGTPANIAATVPNVWSLTAVAGRRIKGGGRSQVTVLPDSYYGEVRLVAHDDGSTGILWSPVAGDGVRRLEISVESPRRRSHDAVTCGGRFMTRDPARAFQIRLDDVTIGGEGGSSTIIDIAQSEELCIGAVSDIDGDGMIVRNGAGDEDGDGEFDYVEACRLNRDPCRHDTLANGIEEGADAATLPSQQTVMDSTTTKRARQMPARSARDR